MIPDHKRINGLVNASMVVLGIRDTSSVICSNDSENLGAEPRWRLEDGSAPCSIRVDLAASDACCLIAICKRATCMI